ncbi:flagellar export protein FliJ [Halotalea alkalilenta]|uniref:Flagellar FliJ protein n=1 Tax=Halotalea alkalilenta TaxID=376489 RepID=A0A172YGE8_9GAMM|nr:flagellar export protein FliJ [Halotalea alkalilenta]ANF58359.1 hypothetical protein A5892_13495 [Halotalea alkalilenta]
MSEQSLKMLIDLATERRDSATLALAELKRALGASESQLSQLEEYRQGYRNRLREAMAQGVSPGQLDNQRRFLEALDTAIAHQRQRRDDDQVRREQGLATWRQDQRKVDALSTLASRRKQDANHRERRLEQLRNDEYASRAQSQYT